MTDGLVIRADTGVGLTSFVLEDDAKAVVPVLLSSTKFFDMKLFG